MKMGICTNESPCQNHRFSELPKVPKTVSCGVAIPAPLDPEHNTTQAKREFNRIVRGGTRKRIRLCEPQRLHLRKSIPPNCSPNFSQKFDQKLASTPEGISHQITKTYITSPTRRAVFTRFFVKKSFVKKSCCVAVPHRRSRRLQVPSLRVFWRC